MKHEWRKKEKKWYLPKAKPEMLEVPAFNFFTIRGEGNPNSEAFADYIAALYAVSYAVRMSHKKDWAPDGYFEYTVYPLEGIWDITDAAKKNFTGRINKDDLVFHLMIRQPDFVDKAFAEKALKWARENKDMPLLDEVRFERIEEGPCIQMLHLGSYNNEPATFELMEQFAEEKGEKRKSKIHREIYLTDARRTAPEKLKTVLRFQLDK